MINETYLDGNRLLFTPFEGINTISAVGTAQTKLMDAVNFGPVVWILSK